MGKGMKCADCGREFRGERRRPCSEHILTLLRRKYLTFSQIDLPLIHDSCAINLHKAFNGKENIQPEVSTENIPRNFLLLYLL